MMCAACFYQFMWFSHRPNNSQAVTKVLRAKGSAKFHIWNFLQSHYSHQTLRCYNTSSPAQHTQPQYGNEEEDDEEDEEDDEEDEDEI